MARNRFRESIRAALADDALQAALDGNAVRRVQGRLSALASLPDWRERRRRAHAVRADVVEHLDDYLQAFVTNAQDNGIQVHAATNAEEAIQIVVEIAGRSLEGKLFAK